MVRECRPPAREPGRSWLARRSTIATSTPASASSPASISPVGPPPAITTAWSAMRLAPEPRHGAAALRVGQDRDPIRDLVDRAEAGWQLLHRGMVDPLVECCGEAVAVDHPVGTPVVVRSLRLEWIGHAEVVVERRHDPIRLDEVVLPLRPV